MFSFISLSKIELMLAATFVRPSARNILVSIVTKPQPSRFAMASTTVVCIFRIRGPFEAIKLCPHDDADAIT